MYIMTSYLESQTTVGWPKKRHSVSITSEFLGIAPKVSVPYCFISHPKSMTVNDI